MSNLYELTNNVSILLYTSQNNSLLRKKIGDNDSKLIETVRGVGYKIK